MSRSRGPAAPLALAAMLAVAPFVQAQGTTGRVGTVTRLVQLFLGKEAALGAAVRNSDAAQLGSLLEGDFELRSGAHAANPVPRAEWMAEVLRTRDAGGEIHGMAVHDFGAVAVASFVQDGARGPIFVVDAWRRRGTGWKLAVRYASPAGGEDFPIPGAAAIPPEIPKKY